MKNTNNKTTKILEKSIKSLRQNLDSISMDSFVATTIETLMGIERDEYLEQVTNPNIDKGNGYYSRAMKTLSSNSLLVNIPRTRTGLFSPATLELLKINREKVRKPSKYQFMSSAMRSAFLSVAGNPQIFAQQKGRLMEDIVAMTLYREFVASSRGALNHDSSKGGADFILTIAEKNIIPIEVGMGEKLGTQVRSTMKKVGSAKYGVVVCRNFLTLLEDANVSKYH